MKKNIYSRAAIILLSIFMLFSSLQVAHGGIVAITDINKHWAKKVINSWIEKGFTNGYKDNTFKPDNTITRAEFIALINRSFGFTEKADIAFTDAKDKDWYHDDIAKAVKAGYVSGCSELEPLICPNKQINRQEAAVMIGRLLHLEGNVVGDSSSFTDVNDFASWSIDVIGAVATTKIMSGYKDNGADSYSFKPINKITRAEAIVSLDRALTYKNNTFNLAGLYGPTSGAKTVEGDVSIQVSGVVLQNMVINGNLVISDQVAEGDATLKNIIVKGTTTINGGGINSIHLENTTMESLIVNKAAGPVRVVAEGTTRITNTKVQSSATLEEDSSLKSQGFQNVGLSGAESGAATAVTLKGVFDKINLDGQSVQMTLTSGSIQTMTVSDQAASNSLNISANGTLNILVLNAQMTFTGQGTIQNATLSESAVNSSFEKQPIKRMDANGAVVPPAAPPVFTSVVAVNSGNNVGLGIRDSVVITFDQNTNKPAVTAANLNSWFTISNGHSFGTSLLNSDITWNGTGNILTIYFSSIAGTTFAVGDTIRVQAAGNLKNSTGTTAASLAVSAPSTGSFTSAPVISSVIAANTGNNEGLGIGDSVAITFDQNTNRPPIKAATLNAMLVLNNGHSFGNLLDRDISWNPTGNILTITFSNVTATTFTVGDTVTVTAAANISNPGGTVASISTSGPSSGSFSTYLEVRSIVAANVGPGNNPGLSVGDTVTITFSTATNHPVITAANFKTWFQILNGHSWGANLIDSNIRWTSNQVLTITFTDVTGATIIPGDSVVIATNANIRDSALKYQLNYILTPPMTGSFSNAPAITSVVASDTGNNAGMGVGDSITITFNQPTNKPYLPGSILNTLLVLSGGHSFGTGLVNIQWNTAGDVLTINLNTIAGVTFAVGDTITPTKAANIKDAAGFSLESVAISPKSIGSFSPIPATPTITSVVAVGSGARNGLDAGDSLVITFNRDTNQPVITATAVNTLFVLDLPHQFGNSSFKWTSPNVLTITFTSIPTDSDRYISIGDKITISAETKIKDATGTSNAYSGTTMAITGNFSAAPKIIKVEAKNAGESPGLSPGDTLKITFDMAMEPVDISTSELNRWFTVVSPTGAVHSFGADTSTYWEADANNNYKTLVIVFGDTTSATFVPGGNTPSSTIGDTIQPTALAELYDVNHEVRVSQIKSPKSIGTFTSPPIVSYFTVDETYDDNTGVRTKVVVTLVFDQPTNKAIANSADLLNGLQFKGYSDSGFFESRKFGQINNASLGWNAAGDTLTFTSNKDCTIMSSDYVAIKSIIKLKDAAGTSDPSTAVYPDAFPTN